VFECFAFSQVNNESNRGQTHLLGAMDKWKGKPRRGILNH
jgi:hypothetical protein